MAALKQGLQSGADVLPKYNWALGMNNDLLEHDRGGWTTSTEMLTGGVPHDWYCFGGLEVGNPYDMDPMGEIRDNLTFEDGEGPQALAHFGSMPTQGGVSGVDGGQMNMGDDRTGVFAPQTYSKYQRQQK